VIRFHPPPLDAIDNTGLGIHPRVGAPARHGPPAPAARERGRIPLGGLDLREVLFPRLFGRGLIEATASAPSRTMMP